jgi:hypothetical protein
MSCGNCYRLDDSTTTGQVGSKLMLCFCWSLVCGVSINTIMSRNLSSISVTTMEWHFSIRCNWPIKDKWSTISISWILWIVKTIWEAKGLTFWLCSRPWRRYTMDSTYRTGEGRWSTWVSCSNLFELFLLSLFAYYSYLGGIMTI